MEQGFFPSNINRWETGFLFYSAVEGLVYTRSYGHLPNLDLDGQALAIKMVSYLIAGLRSSSLK
jgi:hypothetical protein